MKYDFIEHYKQEFPVVVLCRVLGVSESGYYAWRKRPTCERKREDAQLTSQIRQVFENHQQRYGSPRLQVELRDQGRSISRKRVARLMREAGLTASRKRRRVVTTRRDASHPVAPNLLERDFTATEPNTKCGPAPLLRRRKSTAYTSRKEGRDHAQSPKDVYRRFQRVDATTGGSVR